MNSVNDGSGMGDFPPESLIIPHTKYHSKYVGVAENGDLFFITTPFDFLPSGNREFVACYVFNPDGSLKQADIKELGSRADIVGEVADILPGNLAADNAVSQAVIDDYLSKLGKVTYQDIRVKPWAVERFGLTFGLVPDLPEDEEDEEFYDEDDDPYMILEPGPATTWPLCHPGTGILILKI